MKYYYECSTIGDGSNSNPFRPKFAEYDCRAWVEVIKGPLHHTNVIVKSTDNITEQILDDNKITLLDSSMAAIRSAKLLGIKGSDVMQINTLTPEIYGINGNGIDETYKIANMISDIPTNGCRLLFDIGQKITINETSILKINGKNNLLIEGLNATGLSRAVFLIGDGSKNITFRNCIFEDLGQIIYLFDCEQIVVDNCTFSHTGYGIIQHIGEVSNNVKIINCTAENMVNDFVEANCAGGAKSKNWIIANNHYLGGTNFPNYATESRFVGITGVENVIIHHNIVENVCGDSAIHLEDVGGNIIIDHNIINNIAFDGELASYLWIIHNEKTPVIIDNNIFLRTNTEIGKGVVINVSFAYENHCRYTNNVVKGINHNMDGLNLAYWKNQFVMGNTFEDCDRAIITSNSGMPYTIEHNFFTNNNLDTFHID